MGVDIDQRRAVFTPETYPANFWAPTREGGPGSSDTSPAPFTLLRSVPSRQSPSLAKVVRASQVP